MMTDNENLSRTADLARRNAAGIVSDCLDFFLRGVSAQLKRGRQRLARCTKPPWERRLAH